MIDRDNGEYPNVALIGFATASAFEERDERAHILAENIVATSFGLHEDIEWVKRDLVARIAYWLCRGDREQ